MCSTIAFRIPVAYYSSLRHESVARPTGSNANHSTFAHPDFLLDIHTYTYTHADAETIADAEANARQTWYATGSFAYGEGHSREPGGSMALCL